MATLKELTNQMKETGDEINFLIELELDTVEAEKRLEMISNKIKAKINSLDWYTMNLDKEKGRLELYVKLHEAEAKIAKAKIKKIDKLRTEIYNNLIIADLIDKDKNLKTDKYTYYQVQGHQVDYVNEDEIPNKFKTVEQKIVLNKAAVRKEAISKFKNKEDMIPGVKVTPTLRVARRG